MPEIDTSTTEGKIAVMRAYTEGKKIEWRAGCDDTWTSNTDAPIASPIWNWYHCDYRIAPKRINPPRPPWDTIDPEWVAYARDKNGSGWFYLGVPKIVGEQWIHHKEMFGTRPLAPFDDGSTPWDQSLVFRPEEVGGRK